MTEIDLKQYNLKRPEKISWRFPQQGHDLFLTIKSKSLIKFLRSQEEYLSTNGITYEYKKMSDTDFLSWLPYYEEKMKENGYDVIASKEWLEKKKVQGVTIEGMFFHQNGKLVGSGILTRDENRKASFAFKASERIDLGHDANASLGALIDYLFLKEMSEQKVERISAGRSRNAFGVVNTLGYLAYKLKFGYEPTFSEEDATLETLPVNEQGICLCYAQKDGQTSLFAFKPKGDLTTFEVARFSTPELPFVEIEY